MLQEIIVARIEKNNKMDPLRKHKKGKILVIGPLPPPTGGMSTVTEQMTKIHYDDFELSFMDVSKNRLIKSNILFNVINYAYRCAVLFFRIAAQRPDIVHIHMASDKDLCQKYFFYRISKMLKRKTIIHMHSGRFKEYFANLSERQKRLVTYFLNSTDAIIALSNQWKEYYSRITRNKNIFVVENSIENIDHSSFFRIYPKREPIILFIGLMSRQKGIYDLLQAITKIKDPRAKFVFVGPSESEEKRQMFLEEAKRLDVWDRCIIVGEVLGPARFQYYASADIFILASYAEGLPVTILEAMSFGLPIISTNVGAIPEIVKRENGILIKPGDVQKLAKSIDYYIKRPSLRKKIGLANERSIQKNHSAEVFAKKLHWVYEQVQNA